MVSKHFSRNKYKFDTSTRKKDFIWLLDTFADMLDATHAVVKTNISHIIGRFSLEKTMASDTNRKWSNNLTLAYFSLCYKLNFIA